MRRLFETVVLASSLAIGTACATGGETTGGTFVEVVNEVQPPTPVSVYLDEAVGGRTLLGTVEPMSTRTLRIRTVRPTADYRLEARTGGGRSIVSGRFTVSPGETVTWNLGTNVIGP